MIQYAPKSHVHTCCTPNGVVILDLRKDEYLGLPQEQAEPFRRLSSGIRDESTLAVAEELVKNGLYQKKAEVPLASRSLLDDQLDQAPTIERREFVRFVGAVFTAAYVRHFRSLEYAVLRVQRRRNRQGDRRPAPDVETLQRLLYVFRRLRPLAYSAPQNCVFDCIVFADFLAKYRIYPHWILGVTTAPFAAHCWLQADDLSLTDSLTRVRLYTPILAA